MSFTKRLMAHGDWMISLAPETPRWFRRIAEISSDTGHGFNTVICTPARYGAEDIAGDDIADRAQFLGVHRMNDGLVMSGPGFEYYLSDEFGKDSSSQPTTGTRDFSDWVDEVISNNVSAGSVEAISGTFSWTPEYGISAIDALNYVCRVKGAEWRVNNDLTIDAGTISHLYSSTPKAVVGAVGKGGIEPGGYRGVVGRVSKVEHLEDYAYTIECWDQDGNIGVDSRSPTPYAAPYGALQVLPEVRVVDTSSSPAALSAQATARLVYGDDVLKRIYRVDGLGTTRPLEHIGGPGEYLYVFDPAQLILDKTNQIVYRGGPVWPKKLRILAVTTPTRRGQGWYYRYYTGSGRETVDITDFIDWKSEATLEATIEVGHPSESWRSALRDRYDQWLTKR